MAARGRWMRALLATGALVVVSGTGACKGDDAAPEDLDCSVYESLRQGEYVAELPQDPAQFWRGFERCYAEGDSWCERAWVFFSAQPSMADPPPEDLAEQEAAYLEACGTLPEDAQRCLTSWALSHRDECARVGARRRLNEAMDGRAPRHLRKGAEALKSR